MYEIINTVLYKTFESQSTTKYEVISYSMFLLGMLVGVAVTVIFLLSLPVVIV